MEFITDAVSIISEMKYCIILINNPLIINYINEENSLMVIIFYQTNPNHNPNLNFKDLKS